MDYERYQRHFSLIGLEGQKKLNQSSVLIIGCGGVGSPVSLYLAAAGVGRIGLIDHDEVDLSNLQRQILYNESDITKSKALAAEFHLELLNSTIKIKAFPVRLDVELAKLIFPKYDLIIDGTDNFQTRYLVNDICCQLNKPFISASVLKTQAQLGFFNIDDGCYRCLFPDPPPSSLVPNCAEAGVLGSVVGVIGTIAATMALNYFVKDKFPKNVLKIFDSDILTIQNLSYKQNMECLGCIEKKIIPISVPNVTIDSSRIINQHSISSQNYFMIDVRELWERELGHIAEDHLHVPKSQINNQLDRLPKDQKILCYCKAGARSKQVVGMLLSNDFDAYSLDGGFDSWDES